MLYRKKRKHYRSYYKTEFRVRLNSLRSEKWRKARDHPRIKYGKKYVTSHSMKGDPTPHRKTGESDTTDRYTEYGSTNTNYELGCGQ